MLADHPEQGRTEHLANVEIVQGTDTDARLPENAIDLALLVDVYHEFWHPQEMLRSIRRSLKASGAAGPGGVPQRGSEHSHRGHAPDERRGGEPKSRRRDSPSIASFLDCLASTSSFFGSQHRVARRPTSDLFLTNGPHVRRDTIAGGCAEIGQPTRRTVSCNEYRLLLFLCIAALCARSAEASGAYFDGTMQSTSGVCPSTGTVVTVLQTTAGYFTDPVNLYPKTGDVAYVHAVATNISPCLTDVVGFDFFLPDGASLAISAINPVHCIRGRTDNGFSENVPNDQNGACSQTPSTGNFSGLFFGWSKLPFVGNWWLEIQVPVVFNKKLLGIGGPTSHRLTVAVSNAYSAATVAPYQPVTVFYQAAFENVGTTGITANSATAVFDLKSYFHDGTVFVDYGTTNPPPQSSSGTSVPNTSLSFPGSTAPLTGLSASTTFYWQARFVTTDGTFKSPVQSFATTGGGASQVLTVSTFGTGTVTSSPAGINCGVTCVASFASSSTVQLTANPGTGWFLSNWSGACSAFTPDMPCSVMMSAAKSAFASFARQFGTLRLTLAGLPNASSVTIGIVGPDGFNTTRTLTEGFGVDLSDVPTGTYTITAPNTTVAGQFTHRTRRRRVWR